MKRTRRKKTARSPGIGIVVSQFNEYISQRLLNGCLGELKRQGVPQSRIVIHWVPGSFEIPIAALKLSKKSNIDTVICLGAVIRGETYHFEMVAQGAAYGIMQVSLMSSKPIIFGVLTTDTVNQAYKRSQAKGDNKGKDSALAALEITKILSQI